MAATGETPHIRIVSKKADDYRLEFINGAISNITSRGEIVCDFHLETRDRPTEQSIESVDSEGIARLSPFKDTGIFTRDVKFGIVINSSFAKDLVKLLNDKIAQSEGILSEQDAKGEPK
jgi:hypothetical protein